MQKDIFKTPTVFLNACDRQIVLTWSSHRSKHLILVLPLAVLPPSIWTYLLGFFPRFMPETYCVSNITYCVQRSRICFFNTSSYLLPSIDLQILYYVPYSYSLFRDSSSCVGQMAQSVGCIRTLKKEILSRCFYPDCFEFSEMQQLQRNPSMTTPNMVVGRVSFHFNVKKYQGKMTLKKKHKGL